MGSCFTHELCVSSPDLMDGRGAEGETVVTIHIDKLGLFGTYQTALGIVRTHGAASRPVLADLCACRGHAWAHPPRPGWDAVFESGEQDCLFLFLEATTKFPFFEITLPLPLSAPLEALTDWAYQY
jgi:hypothetical protein